MTERALQSKCLELCKQYGLLYINIYGSGRTALGCPDLILCVNGRFVACELKVGKNDLSPAQRIWKRRILAAGGRHYTPRSFSEFKRIVEGEINE